MGEACSIQGEVRNPCRNLVGISER